MKRAVIISAILHVLVVAVAYFGLPIFFDPPQIESSPTMAVEIVMPEQVPQKPVPKPLAQPEPVVPTTAAASRCDRTATTANGDAGARTRAGAASTEGEAEAQTKTEAQSGENGQAEETGKGRAGCTQAEAQTAAARRVSEIAQGFDQAQKAGSQGCQKDAKDRQAAAEAEAHSICLRAPSGRERIVQESTATDCSLLEYPRRRQECAENENRGSHPSQPRWVFTWQSAGYRYKAVSQRSIVPGRGRKCCSRTFEPTLQPFAVTLWPV